VTKEEHIGIVTGLADLVNFVGAACCRTGRTFDNLPPLKTILFGRDISLPMDLKAQFRQTLQDGFPNIELISNDRDEDWRVSEEGFSAPPRKMVQRIVYGNSIHKPPHLDFYASLTPDEFVFIDNGLSSYAEHHFNCRAEFARRGLPNPNLACLSLGASLPVPAYLSDFTATNLTLHELGPVYRQIRGSAAGHPTSGGLPAIVLIGTSLYRTKRITWEQERDIYLAAIKSFHAEGIRDILFKSHPRASDRPLLTADDNIEVFDSSLPVEAFADPSASGVAYSISSTSLFTLRDYFGWQTYRLETPAARALLDRSPHLGLVSHVPAARF
tara:strand:- start:5698 stop:6681 length:984 start_codon:yes stop_codon:yes gene_type:complete